MLKWLKEEHNHHTVSLIGESAGGNLVTMLAAILTNPPAMSQFSFLLRDVHGLIDEDVSLWEYPAIQSVTSWYGILDMHSWKGQGPLSWGLEWTVDAHRSRSPQSFLRSPEISKMTQKCEFLTITEAAERGWITQYPPLLLIAGTTDPLGLIHSSRRAYRVLRAILQDVTVIEYGEYEAGHAFIGLNPFILKVLHGNKWREELAYPATMRTVNFVKSHLEDPSQMLIQPKKLVL